MVIFLYLFSFVTVQLFDFNNSKSILTTNSEKNLEIQILFPDKEKGLKPTSCLNVQVLIINHTDTAASFFEDWNSWGYYNIVFQLKDTGSTFTIYKILRDWPKNFPSFKTLFPGDSLTLNYSLDYDYCYNSQFSGTAKYAESIKAIYQQRKEALENARLTGFIQYKYKKPERPAGSRSRIRYGDDDLIIVDSLKTPVEINRTFPLSKLESKEYSIK